MVAYFLRNRWGKSRLQEKGSSLRSFSQQENINLYGNPGQRVFLEQFQANLTRPIQFSHPMTTFHVRAFRSIMKLPYGDAMNIYCHSVHILLE